MEGSRAAYNRYTYFLIRAPIWHNGKKNRDHKAEVMANRPDGSLAQEGLITRRHFLWITALSGGGLALGCATNPVTGKSQLMLV
jgi:hypothetical protein